MLGGAPIGGTPLSSSPQFGASVAASATDTVAFVDTTDAKHIYVIALSDNAAFTETQSSTEYYTWLLTDNVDTAQTQGVTHYFGKSLTDSVDFDSILGTGNTLSITLTENTEISSGITLAAKYSPLVSEICTIGSAVSTGNIFLDEIIVPIVVTQADTSVHRLTSIITTNIAFTEIAALGSTLTGSITDTFSVTTFSEAFRAYFATLTDRAHIIPVPATVLGRAAVASDTLTATASLSTQIGVVLRDTVHAISAFAAATTYQVSLSDRTTVLGTAQVGWALSATDAVGIAMATSAALGVRCAERIGVLSTLLPTTTYGLELIDRMTLATVMGNIWGGDIEDAITLDSELTLLHRTLMTLAESITITPVLTPQLLVMVTTTDDIELTPTQALRMLYAPRVTDQVQVHAGYLETNGGITTWVANTRMGGITEYQNYTFNSFARIGNKYIGASDEGIYELLGDTDDGDPIIATLKGGFMQFGGTHLSRLKEAYIAAHGEDGEMVLRVETRDGTAYNYQVDTRAGRSTKVHMGKGQRARYFSYTLTSAGQDFRLDTLEFVPIVVQRRV